MAFSYVGAHVRIGDRTWIGPGAVILDGCEIGEDCRISGGAVIGARGFGYSFDGREHVRIPQVGTVKVGDRVYLGAGSCVDCATLDATVIGCDCEIGAIAQIAHNCHVGNGSRLGCGCGLAGSTHLGSEARFGDGVGTAGHSHYGDRVIADDLAGITKTKIPSDTRWAGYPARRVRCSS